MIQYEARYEVAESSSKRQREGCRGRAACMLPALSNAYCMQLFALTCGLLSLGLASRILETPRCRGFLAFALITTAELSFAIRHCCPRTHAMELHDMLGRGFSHSAEKSNFVFATNPASLSISHVEMAPAPILFASVVSSSVFGLFVCVV